MKNKRIRSGIGACIGMLLLILDGKTALEGARSGIDLCIKTVVPSLFPFFLLSMLLTSACMGSSVKALHPVGRLLGIPRGAESIPIAGFLGGYPVGAQSIAYAFRGGQLSQKDAQRLLGFCNNAGPAFLFGMIACLFPRRWMAWSLWIIHIAAAVLTALLLPGKPLRETSMTPGSPLSISAALTNTVRVMATVCGWVILFRVVISFLNRWMLWILPAPARIAVTGLLELSNGCCELTAISDTSLRFILCSGMLAFGGLCVAMQTASVTEGLSLKTFFQGKLMQTCFSLLLAWAVISGELLPCGCLLLLFVVITRKIQNFSRNRAPVGV